VFFPAAGALPTCPDIIRRQLEPQLLPESLSWFFYPNDVPFLLTPKRKTLISFVFDLE
jgi:hypothetical protein